ncbi:hypothetical protein [Burkholderia anthina]|uniref:hypothetical protein n=1 Tax=Burkholderia anthina TaxID=179879 RepID=UPI001AA066FA|nr:hypothetical protein [Burkholderia anthina]QTD89047.1 hypothetical protein J4G50_14680 [Burkholderia anthina]
MVDWIDARAQTIRVIGRKEIAIRQCSHHCDEKQSGKSARAIRHVPEHVTAASQALRYIGVPHAFFVGRSSRSGAPVCPEIPEKPVIGLQ